MELRAFRNHIKSHAEHVNTEKGHVSSEADVRRSLVLPLFANLGYNVHSASEVKAEFAIDKGNARDAVDLVIMRDGNPCIVVECKMGDINVSAHKRQLTNYFQNIPDAKFGVLTNGIKYQFYCDKDQANVMEDEPFLEFDITDTNLPDDKIEILRRFHKANFNLGEIVDIARDQMRTARIRGRISAEIANPSEDFIRFIARDFIRTFRGASATEQAQRQMDQLRSSTKKAFEMVLEDIQPKKSAHSAAHAPARTPVAEGATIEVEVECYHAIRTALAINEACEPSRLSLRQRSNHAVVCLDDNQRKPVARLYLREEKKIIEVYDDARQPCQHDYNGIKDVFPCVCTMVESVEIYDGKRQPRPGQIPQSDSQEAEFADDPLPSNP